MRIKKISLALGLLVLPSIIGLMSCSKKKEGYTVKVSVTDIGTARVFVDSMNTTAAKENIKDSLVSKLKANANGAKITSIKVTYINEKGKKIEDKSGQLDVNGKFEKTYNVQTGKTIIVTATAEGSPVADTMIAEEGFQQAAKEWAVEAWTELATWAKDEKDKNGLMEEEATEDEVAEVEAESTEAETTSAVGWTALTDAVDYLWDDLGWYGRAKDLNNDAWKKSGMPGKPAEVTLPTLSITIEKDGETIAAQSVKASKNGLQPKDLTTANKKTTVSATATAVAWK